MIPYMELAGSPVEEFSAKGFRARRFFLVPWEARAAFAQAVLGRVDLPELFPPAHYPGYPEALAVTVRLRPEDPRLLRPFSEPQEAEELASYAGSFAHAEVEYQLVPEEDLPEPLAGATEQKVSYRVSWQLAELALAADGWLWEGEPSAALPAQMPLSLAVPLAEHTISVRTVLDPPWEMLAELQGKVNEQIFLGRPPETLLFAGVTVSKLYRGNLDAGPSPFAWELKLTLLERSIKQQGGTWGWNHRLRPDTGSWERPLANGSPLYDRADFSALLLWAS